MVLINQSFVFRFNENINDIVIVCAQYCLKLNYKRPNICLLVISNHQKIQGKRFTVNEIKVETPVHLRTNMYQNF